MSQLGDLFPSRVDERLRLVSSPAWAAWVGVDLGETTSMPARQSGGCVASHVCTAAPERPDNNPSSQPGRSVSVRVSALSTSARCTLHHDTS